MNATVKQIIDNTKRALENVMGAEITSIRYRAKYNPENIDRLKTAVCKAYGIKPSDLMRKARYQEFVRPRQMFYYIAVEKMGMKVVDAGNVFNQHHSSAIHNLNKVKDFLSIMDEETHEKLELISEYLK